MVGANMPKRTIRGTDTPKQTTKDTVTAALIAAAATTVVGVGVEQLRSFSVPQRVFYMEARRVPSIPADKHLSVISLINPDKHDIPNLQVSMTSRLATDPQVVDQFGDTDFSAGGTPPQITYANGVITLNFRQLPAQGRYTLFVRSSGPFEVGTSSERAKASSTSGPVRLTKLKREYYRTSKFENWYFLLAGLFGGSIALIVFRMLLRRHSAPVPASD